ncbi:hypothetical protein J4Q44_G00299650 [Coregonus suidteri]|uniref:Uncharacterized protein n=1 Tax=Coregonus suidteri TaxID=861788 RepID=A0AAN8QSJ8_9TELE
MSFHTQQYSQSRTLMAQGHQYLPARPSNPIINGQVIPSFSEILHCEWYWKSHSINIASFCYHNQHLPEQEKRCLFHKDMEMRRKVEFYRKVRREFYENGVLQVFSDEEMEKLGAIPGVLGLAVEMGFL